MEDSCEIYGEMFRPGKVIDNPSDEQLRAWALEQGGMMTQVGNLAVAINVRSRSAKFTEIFHDKRPDQGARGMAGEVRRPRPGHRERHKGRLKPAFIRRHAA